MKALVIACATEAEAGDIGRGLADVGWNIIGSGPVDGVEIREGEAFKDHVNGSWVVLASKAPLQEP